MYVMIEMIRAGWRQLPYTHDNCKSLTSFLLVSPSLEKISSATDTGLEKSELGALYLRGLRFEA